MTAKGIDVSFWQPRIDWEKVKKGGNSFAIIRAAYGASKDTKFDEHIKNAQAQGIDTGAYIYSIATTVDEAVIEADYLLKIIKPYKLTYPVIYDIEDSKQSFLDNKLRTDLCIAFCDRIEKAGYYAMIYANKYWLEEKLEYERLKRFDIWLAQWTPKASWDGNYGIWQTGQANVDGVGNCSIDIAYRDYPDIIRKAGLNHLKDEPPAPPVVTPQPDTTIKIGSKVSIKPKSVWGGLTSARGAKIYLPATGVYVVSQIQKNNNVNEALLQSINSWVAISSLTLQPSVPVPNIALRVGSKVKYKGLVQYSSDGVGGKPISVNGTFTVKQIIKGKKYGVLIDNLGWVDDKDCIII